VRERPEGSPGGGPGHGHRPFPPDRFRPAGDRPGRVCGVCHPPQGPLHREPRGCPAGPAPGPHHLLHGSLPAVRGPRGSAPRTERLAPGTV